MGERIVLEKEKYNKYILKEGGNALGRCLLDDKVSQLIAKYFFSGEEINNRLIKEFESQLKLLKITNKELTVKYIRLFIFLGFIGLNRIRDFALKLYTNYFSDKLNKAISPDIGDIIVSKKSFVIFLCGLFPLTSINEKEIRPQFHKIDKIANNNESVLITGETGTGKELCAKVIHYLSPRRKETFKAINCSGFPETLIESELFGHEKGAFTGATEKKIGIFESVGNGTLFLDEIGDFPLHLQSKLLRVLATGDFYPVGGQDNHPKIFKGRLVTATNKDLKAIVKEDKPQFRSDLYYRLKVFNIELNPIRNLNEIELMKDIHCKLSEVIQSTVTNKTRNVKEILTLIGYTENLPEDNPYISRDAFNVLMNYEYPGNYRELNNILTSAYLLSEGRIEINDLPEEVRNYKKPQMKKPEDIIKEHSFDLKGFDLKKIKIYSEEIASKLLRKKVWEKLEEIYRNDKNLKRELNLPDTGYITVRDQIIKIVGMGLNQIKKQVKDKV